MNVNTNYLQISVRYSVQFHTMLLPIQRWDLFDPDKFSMDRRKIEEKFNKLF